MSNIIQEFLEGVVTGLRDRVDVYILHDKKLVLGHRRNKQGVYYQALPGGGINEDETVEDGARREALEEIGVAVKNIQTLRPPITINWEEIYGKDVPPIIYKREFYDQFPNGFVSHFMYAEFDKIDTSLWGTEDDKYERLVLPIDEVIEIWKKKLKNKPQKWQIIFWNEQVKVLEGLKERV